MAPGYTTQQKSAISQFMSFTQTDRNTAVRHLKSHAWNQEAAVNGFFSGAGGASVTSGAKASLNNIFDKYREDVVNSPDLVAVNGVMTYLENIGVDAEGIDCLVVSEIIQAPTMGEISREGFVDGWTALNCETLEKQKEHMKGLKKTLPTAKDTFSKVYKYTFQLAKTGNQKAVPLETATAYWELLFDSPLSAVKWTSPNTPWSAWWIEFLNASWKKSVNKDMWNQTLVFAYKTLHDETLSFWNEEASWPSVIDDFVEWVKTEKRGGGSTADAMEE